jgi:hypothetical protein
VEANLGSKQTPVFEIINVVIPDHNSKRQMTAAVEDATARLDA